MSDSNNVSAQFGQIPLGGIIMWFGPLALIPKGWLLCDGEAGRPNLVNRFPLGTDDPGDEGGAAEVKLTIANIPSHSHGGETADGGKHTHNTSLPQGGGLGGDHVLAKAKLDQNADYGSKDSGEHTHTIQAEGGDQPFSIMPPYTGVAFIIFVGE